MLDLDNIGEELFNKIRGRFQSVTIGDESGSVTNVPTDARYFDFKYDEDSNVSVSLSEKDGVVVMYNNELFTSEQTIQKENWYAFLKELRSFARKRLLNFDTRDIARSNLEKRDYKYLAKNSGDDNMTESKLYGTGKVSYQDVDKARIVIKHTESVNQERAGGRTQKIGTIHIESSEGERFKYPFKHLNGARAMARHVAEGGNAYDDFGKHIISMSEELNKLKKFKSHMSRNGVMAEGLAEYSDVVNDRIDTVKRTVETLQRKSVYAEAVANFESTILEDVPEDVSSNWIDQLTIRQFNEELSDIFPYIYKLVSEHTKALAIGPQELLGEAVSKQIFLDFSKELIDIQRTDDTEVFTATLDGLGYINDPEEEIDLEGIPVNVKINAFGYVQEGEFEIVSVTGDDGTQYVLDETDTWDIDALTDAFSDALATESAEEIGIDAHFDGMMGQFGEGQITKDSVKKSVMKLLVDIAKTSKQYKGEITDDQVHYLGSLIHDFDVAGIETEKYSEIEKLFRSAADTERADMSMIQPAYAQAKNLDEEADLDEWETDPEEHNQAAIESWYDEVVSAITDRNITFPIADNEIQKIADDVVDDWSNGNGPDEHTILSIIDNENDQVNQDQKDEATLEHEATLEAIRNISFR